MPLLLLFFFSLSSNAQQLNWALRAGSTGTDQASATHTDFAGNVYMVGGFSGITDVDPGAAVANLTSNGLADGFVAKYNAFGQYLWAFSIGGAGIDNVNAITTDVNGNVYITGFFRGNNVDFDPSPATAFLSSNGDAGADPGYGGDIFIAKYDVNGQYLWAINIGGTDLHDNGTAIATDVAGNVYVGGYFKMIADFDPSAATFNLNSVDGTLFLAGYTTNGAFQWAFNTGLGDNDNSIYDIKTDNANNLYVVGYFQGTNIDFDPSPATALLSSAGNYDIFFARYTTNGQYLFAKQVGGPGIDVAHSIAYDFFGNLYIAGDFQGANIDFDPGVGTASLSSNGGSDAFIAKYDYNGEYLWAINLGGAQDDIGWKVSTDNVHLFMAGSFKGTADMNPAAAVDNLVSNGGYDIFLGKYTVSGDYVCAFQVGGPGDDFGVSLQTGNTNTFYLAGSFRNSNVDFDPSPATVLLTSVGNDDAFLAKYDWPDNVKPAGTLTGSIACRSQAGQLTFTATAGTGPFTLVYNNGVTDIIQTNVQSGVPFLVTPNPTATTTYTLVSVQDALRCSETNILPGITATINVNIDSVRIKDSVISCSSFSFKGLAYIHTAAITSWQWSFGDATTGSGQNISHGYAVSGTYNVKLLVTDANGCKDSITIPVNATLLNFDFGNTQNACNPLQVDFFNTGTSTQNPYWSFGDNTTAGTLTASHVYAATGNYPVKFSISTGTCSDTIFKTISVNLVKDNIILTPDTTICFGTTKQLRTPSLLNFCWSPVTYLDNPNSPTPVTSAPQDITYYLTAGIAGTNVVVNGDFTNGNTGFTSSYTFTANNTAGGEYFVGTNPVTWNPLLSNCRDHTTGAGNMLLVNGASVPDVNVWRQTVTVTPNTNYAFATWIEALHADNPSQLQFSINGKVIGNVITASLPTCTWSQFYTMWNSGGNVSATIAIVNKNTAVGGNDFALDDISFAPVTMRRDSVVITVNKPIVKTLGDTALCTGSSVQLTANGAATYTWTPVTGLSGTTIGDPVATPTTTTQYIVTGTNAGGCTAKDTINIVVNPKPVITTTPDTSICRNASIQLLATGGTTYAWSPAATLSNASVARPTATPVDNTMYVVTVTDNNLCSNIDSVKVAIRPLPVFTINADKQVCTGTPVQLTAGGGNVYLWSPAALVNNANISNPLASPLTNTIFTVKIISATCHDSTELTTNITVLQGLTVTAQKSNDIDCGVPFSQLNASGADFYVWTPSAGLSNPNIANPIASPFTTTKYTVTGGNASKCVGADTVVVKVTDAGKILFDLPNAFTPNGDGHNDCFGLGRFATMVQELQFSIYNRMGQRVFYTTNPGNCWDGRFNGNMLPTGSFPYIIKIKTFCGIIERKGIVLLVR